MSEILVPSILLCPTPELRRLVPWGRLELGWAHLGGLSPRVPNNSLSLRGHSTDTAGTAADPGDPKHFWGTLMSMDSKENTFSPWGQALGVAGGTGAVGGTW